MAYNFTKNNTALFDDNFTIVEADTIYKLENWYQYTHDSMTSLSYVYANEDFTARRNRAIKIGGNSVTANNDAFFVSNQYFKYDSTRPYILNCRVKSNTSHLLKFGVIGLTSRPTILKNSGETIYEKEMFNLHRFVFSHNGTLGDVLTAPIYSTQHYVPINKTTPISETYADYVGYITGTTASSITYNTTKGLTFANAVPLREECEYFIPFFSVNISDINTYTILESFTIRDSVDVLSGSVVLEEELVLNNNGYN